jgi:hypothetical protein
MHEEKRQKGILLYSFLQILMIFAGRLSIRLRRGSLERGGALFDRWREMPYRYYSIINDDDLGASPFDAAYGW